MQVVAAHMAYLPANGGSEYKSAVWKALRWWHWEAVAVGFISPVR